MYTHVITIISSTKNCINYTSETFESKLKVPTATERNNFAHKVNEKFGDMWKPINIITLKK